MKQNVYYQYTSHTPKEIRSRSYMLRLFRWYDYGYALFSTFG